MQVRIEVRANGFDRLDPALAQEVCHLTMDQLDAAPVRIRTLGPGLRGERALQVVHQRQQILDDGRNRRFELRLPLTLDALAVVVKLSRRAQQPVVVFVALPLQLVGCLGLGDCLVANVFHDSFRSFLG